MNTRTCLLGSLALAIQLALAQGALAQAASNAVSPDGGGSDSSGEVKNLDLITVTSQKRAQVIIDVPLSVSAYDGKFLEKIGANSLEQVAQVTPGYNMESQDRFAPSFTLRGVSSNDFSAGGESRVSVFQDGIPATQASAAYGEMFDVNRIEIDRGPQSTLHGRSALNGSVSIFQNRADLSVTSYEVGGGIGDYNYQQYYGIANIALSDTTAIRIGAQHKERDGFVKDAEGGNSYNPLNVDSFRMALHWQPSEDVDVNLIATQDNDNEDSGVPFKSNLFLPRDQATGAVIGDLNFWSPLHLSTFGPIGKMFTKRWISNVSGTVDWRLNDTFSITSVSGYRQFRAEQTGDMDGTSTNIIEYDQLNKGKQYNEEVRLNFTDWGIFDGFVGVSYVHQQNYLGMSIGYDERALAMLLGGTLQQTEPQGMTNDEINAALGPLANFFKAFHEDSYGNGANISSTDVFADVTAKVNDKFQLFVGGRASRSNISETYRGWLPYGPSNLTGGGIFFTPTLNEAVVHGNDSATIGTGRAGFRWEIAPQVNVYGVYGVGKRPEALNLDSSGRSTVAPAEVLKSAEVGIKYALLGNRLVGSVAVYKQNYSNFQTQAYVDNGAGGTTLALVNAGRMDAPGLEIQQNYAFNENVSGFITYAYNKSRFQSGAYKGNMPRNAPDHLASIGLDFGFPLSVGGTIDIVPVYSYQSKIFMWDDDDRSDLQQRTPAVYSDTRVDEFQNGYGLLRLNIGYTSASKAWTLKLIGDNLLDKKYLLDAGNTGDNFGIPTFIGGTRRNVRAEFSYKF